jgi:hypothetical protein
MNSRPLALIRGQIAPLGDLCRRLATSEAS